MADKSHGFWELSSCITPRPIAEYTFGWNCRAQCFEIITTRRGVETRGSLSMPPELAEKFLLQCGEPEYGRCFLTDSSPPAKHELCAGGVTLLLVRGTTEFAGVHERHPALELSVRQDTGEPKSLSLPHELRNCLGNVLRNLTADIIRAHLYPQAAVA